jgi:hypothetical protein
MNSIKENFKKLKKKRELFHCLNQYIKWLTDQKEIEGKQAQDVLTHRQQVLILHYLHKYQFFQLNKINPDVTKQATVLSYILNDRKAKITNTSTYNYFRNVLYGREKVAFYSDKNIKQAIELFKTLEMNKIVEGILLENRKLSKVCPDVKASLLYVVDI